MREIKLTNSKLVALVDDEDYERVRIHSNWYLKFNRMYNRSRTVYSTFRPYIPMALIVMQDYDHKLMYDHINRNPLDNRKCNLRLITHPFNNHNCLDKTNSSGYAGVGKWKDGWRARITKDGITRFIGYFKTKEEAALEYNKKAIELYGEYARLNVIKDGS